MALKKKDKKTQEVTLSNGAVVRVKKLSDTQQMRTVQAFGGDVLDKLESGEDPTAGEAVKLFRGNENYLMYVIEMAVELVSEMPKNKAWLKKLKRHADIYGVFVDELDDVDYQKVLYIRFEAMDEFDEQVITAIAMGNEPPKRKVEEPDEPGPEPDEEGAEQVPELELELG